METMEKIISNDQLTLEHLKKETKIIDKEGNPVLMLSLIHI